MQAKDKPEVWIKNQKPTEIDYCAQEQFLKLTVEPLNFDQYYNKSKKKWMCFDELRIF